MKYQYFQGNWDLFDNNIVKRNFLDLFKLHFPEISEKDAILSTQLYDRMSYLNLSYHNPKHILSIFDFADLHQIALTKNEKLIIWFHDVIYRPDRTDNEQRSAEFAVALLAPFVGYEDLKYIFEGISFTGRHLQPGPTPFNLILDLDIHNMTNRNVFLMQSDLVVKEYADYFEIDLNEVKIKRKEFLSSLLNKGCIYRTEYFKNRFETIAVNNIDYILNI